MQASRGMRLTHRVVDRRLSFGATRSVQRGKTRASPSGDGCMQELQRSLVPSTVLKANNALEQTRASVVGLSITSSCASALNGRPRAHNNIGGCSCGPAVYHNVRAQ